MENLTLTSTPEYEFFEEIGLFQENIVQLNNLLRDYYIRAQFSQDKKRIPILDEKHQYLNCFDIKKAVKTFLIASVVGGTALITGIIATISPITSIVMTSISSFLFRLIDMNPRTEVTYDCALFYSYLVTYKHSFKNEAEIINEYKNFKLLAQKKYPNVRIRTKNTSLVKKLLNFNMIRRKNSKYYLNKYIKFSKNNRDFGFIEKK